jgi:TolB-like protein
MTQLQQLSDRSVPADQISAAVDKILRSRIFQGTKLLSRLLRFIVDQSIAGNAASLKESVLGTDVFGRGPAFDPRLDPIVRVDARRLRARLTDYYSSEGASDPVIVELPKGGYAPVFSWRRSFDARTPAPNVVSLDYSPVPESVAVLPFVSLDPDPASQYFSDGLTEEVITALASIPGLRVIGRSTIFCYEGKAQDVRKVGRDLNVRTVVEGTVRRTGTRMRISARLLDTSDCFHLWSEAWEWENADLLTMQKEVSGAIGNITRQTFGKAAGAAS